MASPSALPPRIDLCLCKQMLKEVLGLSSRQLVQWVGFEKDQPWHNRKELRIIYGLRELRAAVLSGAPDSMILYIGNHKEFTKNIF